jgi:hypothetical protein
MRSMGRLEFGGLRELVEVDGTRRHLQSYRNGSVCG